MAKFKHWNKTNYPRWVLVNDEGTVYTDDQEVTVKRSGSTSHMVCRDLVFFANDSLAKTYLREEGLRGYRPHRIPTFRKWWKLLETAGASPTGLAAALVVHGCDDSGTKSYVIVPVE